MADAQQLPVTLVKVLANSVILRHIAPYIPLRGLLALAATCKTLRNSIYGQLDPWRHLDLTCIAAAQIDSSPIDVGGVSWRAERMDESLTEDEFYSGPLRGVFSWLEQKELLKYVQTLILDGLPVPADLVAQILMEDRFNVKILSIREAQHLNESKLQQTLRYSVRPTRAEGTPRLKALYFFGAKGSAQNVVNLQQRLEGSQSLGVTESEGAQIGAVWNQRSSTALTSCLADEEAKWYTANGRALRQLQFEWPETLQVCKDLIAFDAVLCRGPRHDITKVESKDFLQPKVATVALGPGGCETCHSCPESPAIFGESPESTLPLLGPPPLHTSTVRAAQRPHFRDQNGNYPNLILRCEDCLRGRWCERCNRWWCEDCYQEPVSRLLMHTDMQQLELRDDLRQNGWDNASVQGPPVKIIGVHRDCWGCGRVCEDCKAAHIKRCRNCGEEYCRTHDDGCSGIECAWCSHSGRRTRELF